LQALCDKLKNKLQESEANGVRLKQSNDSLRNLIERLEREKNQLETQLRKKQRPAVPAAISNR
jgi:chromosome segregation ATPase